MFFFSFSKTIALNRLDKTAVALQEPRPALTGWGQRRRSAPAAAAEEPGLGPPDRQHLLPDPLLPCQLLVAGRQSQRRVVHVYQRRDTFQRVQSRHVDLRPDDLKMERRTGVRAE